MKAHNTSIGTQTGTIRAGLISLLVPGVIYLWMVGLGDLSRTWLFIVSFAFCLVLMMQSLIDLLVLAFGLLARFSGKAVGRTLRFAGRIRGRLRVPGIS